MAVMIPIGAAISNDTPIIINVVTTIGTIPPPGLTILNRAEPDCAQIASSNA